MGGVDLSQLMLKTLHLLGPWWICQTTRCRVTLPMSWSTRYQLLGIWGFYVGVQPPPPRMQIVTTGMTLQSQSKPWFTTCLVMKFPLTTKGYRLQGPSISTSYRLNRMIHVLTCFSRTETTFKQKHQFWTFLKILLYTQFYGVFTYISYRNLNNCR